MSSNLFQNITYLEKAVKMGSMTTIALLRIPFSLFFTESSKTQYRWEKLATTNVKVNYILISFTTLIEKTMGGKNKIFFPLLFMSRLSQLICAIHKMIRIKEEKKEERKY